MYQIHPNARTTPAVRAALATSTEPTRVLAQRYGISTETVRKWRHRGAADCQDHSARPHHLRWRATDEERAIVCTVRRATGLGPLRPKLRSMISPSRCATSCRTSTATAFIASSKPRGWAACLPRR